MVRTNKGPAVARPTGVEVSGNQPDNGELK